MKHAWVIRLLVGSTLAVAAPILGIADVSAQVGTADVFQITIAAATARNPRNSESDIIELRDGRLLLGTGDLLAVWNNDLGRPRARNPLTAAISRDDGKTWEHFRNVADAAGDAFAYPSVTFVGDRALLTYFNYHGGISLLLQGIPVTWFYE